MEENDLKKIKEYLYSPAMRRQLKIYEVVIEINLILILLLILWTQWWKPINRQEIIYKNGIKKNGIGTNPGKELANHQSK